MAEKNEDADDRQDEAPGSGVLYVVSTPVGNLEDITARALRILRECDLIAAEDTRRTRKLLSHFDIHSRLVSYHAHASDSREHALLSALREGKSIALVSDAGTPAVSDPGAELVAAAVAAGVRVEPAPGASALLAALVASGLPTARFVFEGFLPRTRSDRWERIRHAAAEERTVVFYEAPMRLVETLEEMAKAAGRERPVVVAREVTKKFEEFRRGSLDGVIAHFRANPPRGECTIILGGAPPGTSGVQESVPDADPEMLVREALGRGISPRDAAREVARITGLPRRAAYALAVRLTAPAPESPASERGPVDPTTAAP